eukprot:191223-Chlamydomonas_euryale.AAC.1
MGPLSISDEMLFAHARTHPLHHAHARPHIHAHAPAVRPTRRVGRGTGRQQRRGRRGSRSRPGNHGPCGGCMDVRAHGCVGARM